MFESLQEGIVVIQDNCIAFTNSLFKQLFDKKSDLLDQEIFKVYSKEVDDDDVENTSRSGNSGNKFFQSGKVVSINQIIKLNPIILND